MGVLHCTRCTIMPDETVVIKDEINAHLAELTSCERVVDDGLIECFPFSEYEEVKQKGFKTVKVVHFTRHGQGFHNLRIEQVGYPCQCGSKEPVGPCPYMTDELTDAFLTEKGEAQARALSQKISESGIQVECVITSPLSRAIQTGRIALDLPQFQTLPWISQEYFREQYGRHMCDKRRTKTELMDLYPNVDFSALTETDEWFGDERETRHELAKRCLDTVRFIQQLQHDHVFLFSHSSFLCTLFGVVFNQPQNSWFETAEMRSFVIGYRD